MRKDIVLFGKALTEIQYITGNYFSRYQAGVFCCRESEEAVKLLLRYGVYGVGQSSWGPAVYGVVDSKKKASYIAGKVVNGLRSMGISVKYVFISRPRNRGYILKYF